MAAIVENGALKLQEINLSSPFLSVLVMSNIHLYTINRILYMNYNFI